MDWFQEKQYWHPADYRDYLRLKLDTNRLQQPDMICNYPKNNTVHLGGKHEHSPARQSRASSKLIDELEYCLDHEKKHGIKFPGYSYYHFMNMWYITWTTSPMLTV